jgi:proteic killer suppression protein
MIKSFRHKGLRRYFEEGRVVGVNPGHVKKLRMLLTALDTAIEIEDMDIPGFGLHPLRGDRKGQWAVKVSGNWRLTFQFRDGNAYLLEYEDYH